MEKKKIVSVLLLTISTLKLTIKYFHSSIMCSLGKTRDMSSMTQTIPGIFKFLRAHKDS